MGSVSRATIFGEASHRALLQLFDPLDFPLKTVADVDSEPRVFCVEDVPLWATLKGVGVSLDKVFESVDPGIELPYFSGMVVLSVFNRLE